ncbi:unnamed protein product [Lactuca saligna]|uniref:At2g35280-like TPR domain-containing protein n=1 Tax=Lactuca saligna TaxID=75948 RepID=A0AA35YX98_LACSI|nr:unnamed protein product [Lactuca saligna]
MDEIWVMDQVIVAYSVMVHVAVGYSVMVTPIDDIWVMGFLYGSWVNVVISYSVMGKYFLLGEDEAWKQLLQEAANKGQLDAVFILGMLLMAEGSERKQEALIMLNNAYINTRRSWNLRQTGYKVRSYLVRRRRSKQIQLQGLNKSYAKHPFVSRYGKSFMHEYSWLFNCDISLWDACLVKFAKMFDISLE